MDRIEQLRKFIAAQPNEAFPRYALALELKGKGEAAEAAGGPPDLPRRAPDYLATYLMLGMILQTLGRNDEAREAFAAGQDIARKQGNTHTLSELTSALETLG